jgi:hypothetical protein
MTEPLLDFAQIGHAIERVRGGRRTQGVRAKMANSTPAASAYFLKTQW